jgi:hypothetical protein
MAAWKFAERDQFWANLWYRFPSLGTSLFFFIFSVCSIAPGMDRTRAIAVILASLLVAAFFCLPLFGLGLLIPYWRETLGELRRQHLSQLLKAVPKAAFWVGAVLGSCLAFGGFVGKFESRFPLLAHVLLPILVKCAIWCSIAYGLLLVWSSRTVVGLLGRLILLLLFTLVLLLGLAGSIYAVCRHCPLALVGPLATVVLVNFCMFFSSLKDALLSAT